MLRVAAFSSAIPAKSNCFSIGHEGLASGDPASVRDSPGPLVSLLTPRCLVTVRSVIRHDRIGTDRPYRAVDSATGVLLGVRAVKCWEQGPPGDFKWCGKNLSGHVIVEKKERRKERKNRNVRLRCGMLPECEDFCIRSELEGIKYLKSQESENT
eukprot:g8468.t1